MKDMPPGYPSLLRPENTKNATLEAMERALDHVKSCLPGIDIEWWISLLIAKDDGWKKMDLNFTFEFCNYLELAITYH